MIGITLDTINFVEGVMLTEINSATDNPLVFSKDDEGEADIISAGKYLSYSATARFHYFHYLISNIMIWLTSR